MTQLKSTKRPGRPRKKVTAKKKITIRATEDQLKRYKNASKIKGKTMAMWIKELADQAADRILKER